jgi:ABC-type transport system involved in cytochrome c biogenesis permease subunit
VCALIAHSVSILLYAIVRKSIPMDMMTQDVLLRSWGLGLVLIFVSQKYKERYLSQAVILASLLLFAASFPMPLPSEMKMCPHFSKGIIPLSVLLYDISVVIFAYCFSLSILFFYRKRYLSEEKDNGILWDSIPSKIGSSALWGVFIFTVSHVIASFGQIAQFGTYWGWNPMHLMFVSVWFLYAGMIHLQWINGFPEKASPIMGIIGFICISSFRVIWIL